MRTNDPHVRSALAAENRSPELFRLYLRTNRFDRDDGPSITVDCFRWLPLRQKDVSKSDAAFYGNVYISQFRSGFERFTKAFLGGRIISATDIQAAQARINIRDS